MQSSSWRHFRALSRKNAINWKRTPLGSLTEVLCPLLLMAILVYVRSVSNPLTITGIKIEAMRHPLYQPAKPDTESGKFVIDPVNVLENALDFNEFMRYTNYANIKRNVTLSPNTTARFTNKTELFEIDTYLPFADPLGPYLFYPS